MEGAAKRGEACGVQSSPSKHDASRVIDHERGGDSLLPERVGQLETFIDELLIGEVPIHRECRHFFPRLANGYSDDDCIAASASLCIESLERWHLADARVAPCRPKGQDGHTSAQNGAQIRGSTFKRHEGRRRKNLFSTLCHGRRVGGRACSRERPCQPNQKR